MRARHLLALGASVGAILALYACGSTERSGLQRQGPRPLIDLAAQSYAGPVSELAFLPSGPGAEGRIGDLLLENANVRFVVAAADHAGPGYPAGNVIDAAVQGGEDRMRLLAPMLGSGPTRRPAYESVRVESAGGLHVPAIVVAEGRLIGSPQVKVRTSYSLPPDSVSLEISTRVENGTGASLDQFVFSDSLCHGRTLRFVPQPRRVAGRMQATAGWLSFFWGDRSWGVLCMPGTTMDVVHDLGLAQMELRYGQADILPGESRSYRRFLMAAAGGPEKVWQVAYPTPENMLSHLAFQLNEEGTDQPVPGAQIVVAPDDRRSPVLLVTGSSGRVELDLRAGRYAAAALAPGRPPVPAVPVTCGAGQSHVVSMYLSARAQATVLVKAKIGEFATPADARLTCYSSADQPMPFPFPLDFPVPGESGVALASAMHGALVPLTPFSPQLPGSSVIVVSKGPLFGSLSLPVAAAAGMTASFEPALERAVDAGAYLAVDLRQYTDASPDCSLTLDERALSDSCEGLQAAVVSDPVLRTVLAGAPSQGECLLMPGCRLALDGQGSFSFYPVEEAPGQHTDIWALAKPDRPAAQVLKDIRERFPKAIIQVDSPLDQQAGYFALAGFEPGLHVPALVDFDAVEVLSGRDVAGARKALACWFYLLNSGRKVMATGGSGSRATFWETAGCARTFIRCPKEGAVATADEVKAAIARLKTTPDAFVTNGPFIEATLNDKPFGSLQTVRDGQARLQLRVSAPLCVDVAKATVYRDGEAVQEIPIPETTTPLRCDRVVMLEARRDCWFVVVVEGRKPMSAVYSGGPAAPTPFAVTNPFYVDADGDGEVRLGR